MNEFVSQFGLDWKLFLSQLVNFALILIVLKFFVYNPVIKILKEKNKKIKEGLDKAEEAGVRLKEIDVIGKTKIKEAETTSINMIRDTEHRAKVLEQELHKKIEENQKKLEKEIELNYKKQQEQANDLVLKNAVEPLS
ncbi:MAG: hypothetical protein NTY04_00250 [Candidatus Staskawiczbacteria bacterium]|nr:hypothetical protein [Candidatus Staskawiczbacteria bacterium]